MTPTPYAESEEPLVLVDENDVQLAVGHKFETHRRGRLHRAFSVFVFTSDGKLRVQRRAPGKYHSGGKWANTACGHPRPGESVIAAGERRLREETGLVCRLQQGFCARYRAELDNDMIENELVHLLFGVSDAPGSPDPGEVAELAAVELDQLRRDVRNRPEAFAVWLQCYVERHEDAIGHWRDRLTGEDCRTAG